MFSAILSPQIFNKMIFLSQKTLGKEEQIKSSLEI